MEVALEGPQDALGVVGDDLAFAVAQAAMEGADVLAVAGGQRAVAMEEIVLPVALVAAAVDGHELAFAVAQVVEILAKVGLRHVFSVAGTAAAKQGGLASHKFLAASKARLEPVLEAPFKAVVGPHERSFSVHLSVLERARVVAVFAVLHHSGAMGKSHLPAALIGKLLAGFFFLFLLAGWRRRRRSQHVVDGRATAVG